MNILRVIKSMNPKEGGPCQGIRNSIPALKAMGIHNEVVCFDDPDSDYLNEDFKIHALGEPKGPYAYNKELQSWLSKNFSRFDAVIVHGLWLYHSYGTYKAWEKYKKNTATYPKLYIMPHGMLDPYFQKAKERRLKAIRNWVFYKLIEGRVINNATGVLFTCEEELLLARTTFTPYHPKEELNVSYGIQEPPVYTPQMKQDFLKLCPKVTEKPYILFLSRIHEKKGVDLLLNSYISLKNKYPEMSALVVAGPGMDTDFGKRLSKAAEETKDIYFPGMLTGNAKWGAFYGCEVFVLPSHQENFGIALVEALACGKPALITNKVNIWREIVNGRAGFVGEDTQLGIDALLNEWLNFYKKGDNNSMGQNANSLYKNNFTVKEAAKKLVSSLKG
ncbi:glycosyltransferase [Flavobacterium rhizosphaerae]|uniref:Glycosyltransferase n=1 Tax=Flavobacterium rhizosphaerae TaxID=3163298 RepID=A0ABW8YY67_9FLAO